MAEQRRPLPVGPLRSRQSHLCGLSWRRHSAHSIVSCQWVDCGGCEHGETLQWGQPGRLQQQGSGCWLLQWGRGGVRRDGCLDLGTSVLAWLLFRQLCSVWIWL